MRMVGGGLEFSASDLIGHLNCKHLSELNRRVLDGLLTKPSFWDPSLELLRERGLIHETAFIDHLIANGSKVVRIEGADIDRDSIAQTLDAMRTGVEIIVQGALSNNGWTGRPDVLRRVDLPSLFGSWSYEALDTKLARQTKAATVLQLCLYSDLLREVQGVSPQFMHVVAPWTEYRPEAYRVVDFAAYFRMARHRFEEALSVNGHGPTYPDPQDHCDVCAWQRDCDKRRREDDHLCLVAGISKAQIHELNSHNILTTKDLAQLSFPLSWKPQRGSVNSLRKIQHQARLQVEARQTGELKCELLPFEEGFGLACLPTPSAGDIFFDLEGDPFVGRGGQEYLFGYLFRDSNGLSVYRADWALTREDERRAFETFVDFVIERWREFPDLHIFHYAPYEPSALKRLMGRYATREEEIDRMLHAKLFVDLYSIVRQSIRASVESYSIKKLELFYSFSRNVGMDDANRALASLQAALELGGSVSIQTKSIVQGYNEDDCLSTYGLRQWLESLREQIVKDGTNVQRPEPGGTPSEKVTDWIIRIGKLVSQLTANVPIDPTQRDDEQHGRWILANTLDWHRREAKATWWEYFRLADLPAEDLLDERVAISGLTFIGISGGTAKAPIHRYRFPPQETELRGGEELKRDGGASFGWVHSISAGALTIDIKKMQATAEIHPSAVFAHKVFGHEVQAESLVRIGEYVVSRGLRGDGPYRAARDLLLRSRPPIGNSVIRAVGESTLEAANRLATTMREGILSVQGPPGTGKTYTGAQMICAMVTSGKRVGITANSHKVIRNLIDATIKVAKEWDLNFTCCQKPDKMEQPSDLLTFARSNRALLQSFDNGTSVGGGTSYLWADADAFEMLDVLFVDEAAQMSLANVLAVSQAAKMVVLIGDPQQLDQPTKGTHPDGVGVSALHHILGERPTIDPDEGLFLEETWRLHPSICAFTSELFYSGKLRTRDGLQRQRTTWEGPSGGAGLFFLPVEHVGNKNCSAEEAAVIYDLITMMLACGTKWTNADGLEKVVTLSDILIITPYNAQVFEIQQLIPGARVGTVDKFQGQEAPIAIYSTATSSPSDAPRGMEFLYSPNRLNVATSRARCMSILVGSPLLFEADCRTPQQMRLANAFCRYLELAHQMKAVAV